MLEQMTQEQAKRKILEIVSEYCDAYHGQQDRWKKGGRIPYASRVYTQYAES